jgi:thymidylate synthase (FAD)
MEKYEKSIKIYDDNVGCVDYVDHMGSDLTIVNSARVSFGVQKSSLDGRDKRLISYLVKHRHTSTFEHNVVTFKFTVPLFVRSQHHRHRTWSYNEISRRYTEKGLKFYTPNSFRTQHESNRQASNADNLIDPQLYPTEQYNIVPSNSLRVSGFLKDYCINAVEYFNKMIKAGICREQARMILPQNLYTEYYATVNLNNLLKFIDLRTHEGAQWEIQKAAEACLEIATELWPVAVKSYREVRGVK